MSDSMDNTPPSLTEDQLVDFALLLARHLTPPANILWLARAVLGPDALRDVGNDISDVNVVAQRAVESLHAAGRIPEAVSRLRYVGPNTSLLLQLNEILRGGSLRDSDAMQAFSNEYEPFLSSATFQEKFPRIARTVCAIAVGHPHHQLRGTGFLVGPDLVMTNHHIMEPLLANDENARLTENLPGDGIFCFFDYLWPPQPSTPYEDVKSCVSVRAVTAGWLVSARPKLDGDGMRDFETAQAGRNYDYCIIRLSRAVGSLPSLRGGGENRGWLSLPMNVDPFGGPKRVIVHQHPGGGPQQFDIGTYVALDHSGTRLRYTVSTAKGSSGGAAVDATGDLVALHVSEVARAIAPGGARMNQGVRIDLIAQDLAAAGCTLPSPPAPSDSSWSLTDDLYDPQPIIGRSYFRQLVAECERDGSVLVVSGPANSGVHFSTKLLRRTVGPQTPVVEFSASELSTKSPESFLRSLAAALGLSTVDMPALRETETVPRWLRVDLPRWIAAKLGQAAGGKRVRFPAWIVLDTVAPGGARFDWAENLIELVAALAGARDPGQEVIEIPQLRFLFLAPTPSSLLLGPVVRRDDDLTTQTDYCTEFISCLQRAQHAFDRNEPFGGVHLWGAVVRHHLAQAPGPPRQVLRDFARGIIREAVRS